MTITLPLWSLVPIALTIVYVLALLWAAYREEFDGTWQLGTLAWLLAIVPSFLTAWLA